MRIRFSPRLRCPPEAARGKRQDAKDAENRRIKQRKEIRQDVGLKKKVTKGYEKLREVTKGCKKENRNWKLGLREKRCTQYDIFTRRRRALHEIRIRNH